ncbi:TRAP transporter substrate-binding protein [Leisingera sp. ANG59]|uniref:TRAP transporter substrate-binding protein n=1 Tax=Leisingera sp. ANG59 TaxID=2675221 RepID=UPI0015718481|nr:TRAP transporter substrate-binding protein [Leisingera sp. ANG59]NSY39354.1 C4-dicarboxylate ABC transporter [Leisingera sp. ANG59]
MKLIKQIGQSIVIAAVVGAGLASGVWAQDVTLRLHQFLPAPATVPAQILKPWAEAIEEDSGGRLRIQHFDAMSLGGTPPELMDQARDGVADITMAIVGYTPNRFPRTEVFELPFIMTSAEATSRAYWDLIESELQDGEFKDVQVLAGWVHGPGAIHSKNPVRSLEDLVGQKLRAPTRVSNDLLKELGATPVGIPLPATAESLSKGVIDGTVISWEVVPALRLNELVGYHTDFAGANGLYTTAIVLVMNKLKYDGLPEDLRAILDKHSGMELSATAGRIMQENDQAGRDAAKSSGNEIIVLDEAEVARWKAAAKPVYERWYEAMKARDIDGRALVDQVAASILAHSE